MSDLGQQPAKNHGFVKLFVRWNFVAAVGGTDAPSEFRCVCVCGGGGGGG